MNIPTHRKPSTKRVLAALAALGVGAVALCGCTSRLARENILANTETAYGITLAENAQTQIPELKMGYARHELFYVPSSKTLAYHDPGKSIGGEVVDASVNNGDPSKTPQVLAEIAIGTSLKRSQNTNGESNRGMQFRVRQRLAVGSEAVKAPAAGVLMASGDAQAAEILRNMSVSSFADQEQVKRALLEFYVSGAKLNEAKAAQLKETVAQVAAEEGIAAPPSGELSDFIHDAAYARLRRLVAVRLKLVDP